MHQLNVSVYLFCVNTLVVCRMCSDLSFSFLYIKSSFLLLFALPVGKLLHKLCWKKCEFNFELGQTSPLGSIAAQNSTLNYYFEF